MLNEPLITQILNLRAYNAPQVPKVAVGISKTVGAKPILSLEDWLNYIVEQNENYHPENALGPGQKILKMAYQILNKKK